MTIILDHVSKTYNGREVLKDFYLEVEDKRIYQIVGPKESGKTTILKIFLGEEKPDVGRVARMGDYKYPTLQSAYVPQENVFKEKKSALWHVKKAHRNVSTGRALDEPFETMNEEQIQKALKYILDKQGSRPILITTKTELPIKNSRVIQMGEGIFL